MMVEAYLVAADGMDRSSVDNMVLCTLEDPGRSMLFPAFRYRHLQLETFSLGAENTNCTLTLATTTGTRFTLRCSGKEQGHLWKAELESLFPKKQVAHHQEETNSHFLSKHAYSSLASDASETSNSTGTKSFSFTSKQNDILSDSCRGLNILSPAQTSSVTSPAESSFSTYSATSPALDLNLPLETHCSSRSTKYSNASPQLGNFESSLSFSDEPELKAYLTTCFDHISDDIEIISCTDHSVVSTDDEHVLSDRAGTQIVMVGSVATQHNTPLSMGDASSRYSSVDYDSAISDEEDNSEDDCENDIAEYDSSMEDNTESGIHEALASQSTLSEKPLNLVTEANEQQLNAAPVRVPDLPLGLPPCPPCPTDVSRLSTESDRKDEPLSMPQERYEEVTKTESGDKKLQVAPVEEKPVKKGLLSKSSSGSLRSFFLRNKRSTDILNNDNKKNSAAPSSIAQRQTGDDIVVSINPETEPEKDIPTAASGERTLKRKPSTTKRLANALKSLGAKFKKPSQSRSATPAVTRALDMKPDELKSVVQPSAKAPHATVCSPAGDLQSHSQCVAPSGDVDLVTEGGSMPVIIGTDHFEEIASTGDLPQVLEAQSQRKLLRAQKALSKISEEVYFDQPESKFNVSKLENVKEVEAQSDPRPTQSDTEANEEQDELHDVSMDSEFSAGCISTAVTAVMASPILITTSTNNNLLSDLSTPTGTTDNMIKSTSFASSIGTAVDIESNNETVKLGHSRKLSNGISLRSLCTGDSATVTRKSSESTLADLRANPFKKVSILRTQAVVSKWQSMNWARMSDLILNVDVFVTNSGGLIKCTLPFGSDHSLNVITEEEENDEHGVAAETRGFLELTLQNGLTQISRRTALDVHVRQAGDTTYLFRLRTSYSAEEFLNTVEASTEDLSRQVLLNSDDGSNPVSPIGNDKSTLSMNSSNSSGSGSNRQSLRAMSSNDRLKMHSPVQGMATFLPPLLSTRNGSAGSLGGTSPVTSSKSSLITVETMNRKSPDILSNSLRPLYHEPELLLLNNLRCHLFKHGAGDKWLDVGLARLRVYSVPLHHDWRRVMLLKAASTEVIFDARLPRACFQMAGSVGVAISVPQGQMEIPVYMLRLRSNKEAVHLSELFTC